MSKPEQKSGLRVWGAFSPRGGGGSSARVPSPMGGDDPRHNEHEENERKRNGRLRRLLPVAAAAAAAAVLAGGFYGWKQARRHGGGSGENTAGGDRKTLTVTTEPPGATLWINDRLAGVTPLSLRVPSGVYGLRAEKAGLAPTVRRVRVDGDAVRTTMALRPPRTGTLKVAVEPEGAEVLLDGERAGLTPLTLRKVKAGEHEVVVRKTNYEPEATRVRVPTGGTAQLAGFALEDKILAMLKRAVAAEPYRVAGYTQLGQYVFLQGRMEEAATWFAKGLAAAHRPFKPRPGMTEEDLDFESARRREEYKKLLKELKRHRWWPGRDTQAFRTKLDLLQLKLGRENVGDWNWVEPATRNLMRERKYALAEQLLREHVEAAVREAKTKGVEKVPPPAQGLILLTEVQLRLRNLRAAKKTWDRFFDAYRREPSLLRQMGNTLYTQRDRLRGEERAELLATAEKTLRTAAAAARSRNLRAQCRFELAGVLRFQGRTAEAVAVCREAVKETLHPWAREDRQLCLAAMLREAERGAEAAALYRKLLKSERHTVRAAARAGLAAATAEPAKRH